MKIIPRKIKVKNTVWKCYSLLELIFILLLSILCFIFIINKYILIGIIIVCLTAILFMPTTDGIVYNMIYDLLKYLFSKKRYTKSKNINKIVIVKDINDEGIIQYFNNTYSRVIKIGQKNFLIQDEENQELDIEYFNKSLKQIDISSVMDIVKIDQPINFDNYIIDLEDKLEKEKMSTVYSTKSVKENILIERKKYINFLNNEKKQYISSYYVVIYSNNMKDLNNTVDNFIYEIKKCGITARLLNIYETAIFLKYSFSKQFDEREVYKIDNKQIINWIYPDNIKFCMNKYFVDNIEASVFTISDCPLKVKNGWASTIFNIENSKVVMRIKPVEKYRAIKKIDKCLLEIESKEKTAYLASETNESMIHKKTIYELLNKIQAEDENLLDVNITVTAYNYDNNNNYRRNIKRKINNEGFRTTTLLCNQYNGFMISNICNINKLFQYTKGINSKTLASSFPFIINHLMDKQGIVIGESLNKKYPFIFDIWKRGELYQNSNAFVIGKSGSGKTYFLKNLLINEWSNSTRIIICDPEAEYLNITKKLNGNIIDVGNAKEGKLNPFHIYKILTENGEEASSFITFNAHLKTLESFFKIVLNDISNDVLELINSLVIDVYNYKGINEQSDFTQISNSDYPIFSDLLFVIEEKISDINDQFMLEKYKLAKLHLLKFTSGRYSDIWNNPSTLEVEANIINFNFQALFANKNNIVANAQMLLIFRFIEQEIINKREQNNNKKTIIIVDEAHMFIDSKYPVALDFFYQMNKRIRKYNGSFIPTTQNISDLNCNNELKHKTSTIIKNSQYTFIFKSSSLDMQDILDIYKSGNSFNKEERKIIISLSTGQAFFIGSSELRFPVNIVMNNNIRKLFIEEE